MKHRTHILIAGLLSGLMGATVVTAADQKAGAPSGTVSRYSGVANVPGHAGAAATAVRVEIKDLALVRNEQGIQIPATGFYIVQLKSGRVDTEIAGKKEQRHAGDFWTVAAGEPMKVIFPPHSQSAQLQTVAITPGGGKR